VRNTTLPLIKYGIQYIGTHVKFIWRVPNYFIIQPLGGRLTSCKMAANGEEKAFCVLHFHVSRSVLTVKREFHIRFKKEPPAKNSIWSWYDKFRRTGCLCKGNRQVGLRLPGHLWKELESLFNAVRRNLQQERAGSLVFPKQLCGAYCVSVYKCTLIDWWCYSTWDEKITQNACTFVCHFKTCAVMMIIF